MQHYARFRAVVAAALVLQSLNGCARSKNSLRSTVSGVGSSSSAQTRPAQALDSLDSWKGVYASPSEIGGFSGTVLVLDRFKDNKDLSYRIRFYTDVHDVDAVEEDERFGSALADGEQLYLPQASARKEDGKITTIATISRYRRATINSHVVLMRDDAWKAYTEQNALYDYGILIKVASKDGLLTDLKKVKHESIKSLYADPSKLWNDPFVFGPNAR